jgi:hypothetical protein
MEMFEYRVDAIQAAVTEKDITKGVAGKKVAGQVEMKLKELSKEGYEFYREFPVDVKVQKGCMGVMSKGETNITIIVMVFRRSVK